MFDSETIHPVDWQGQEIGLGLDGRYFPTCPHTSVWRKKSGYFTKWKGDVCFFKGSCCLHKNRHLLASSGIGGRARWDPSPWLQAIPTSLKTNWLAGHLQKDGRWGGIEASVIHPPWIRQEGAGDTVAPFLHRQGKLAGKGQRENSCPLSLCNPQRSGDVLGDEGVPSSLPKIWWLNGWVPADWQASDGGRGKCHKMGGRR